MAKSQETFNKKEKEKLKLKKRQEKMNRKEERKANAGSGSLESMMAYVDEFGNITDTPQDPSQKKKVNASSIELGVPKREEEPEEKVREGKVAFYNSSKGYGFIKDLASQENIFVHINGIIDPIDEGDRVTFEMVRGQKGMNAVHVRKVK
jgi:cold shock CspA family protein